MGNRAPVSSANFTPAVPSNPPLTNVSSPNISMERVGSPQTTPEAAPVGSSLSPHSQSGMIPTENISSSYPSLQGAKIVPPPPSRSIFPQGQKMAMSKVMVQQHPPMPPMRTTAKTGGKKLFGFFMFAAGIICGAIVMHAYLNGYLDSVIQWVMTMTGQTPPAGA